MPLPKSRKKTNEFFSRAIKSLKSMLVFHGGRSQVTDARPPCHPFSSSRRNITGKDDACCRIKHQKKTIIDEFYSDGWNNMVDDHDDQIYKDKVIVVSSSNMKINDEQCLNINKEKKNQQQHDKAMEMNNDDERSVRCYKLMNKQDGGGIRRSSGSSCRVISQRMKELEMMEFKDVDHVLDVEEVLHYYSRLRSPVYLDIVDSFFTDMYAELLHKPQGNCFHGSKRTPPLTCISK